MKNIILGNMNIAAMMAKLLQWKNFLEDLKPSQNSKELTTQS